MKQKDKEQIEQLKGYISEHFSPTKVNFFIIDEIDRDSTHLFVRVEGKGYIELIYSKRWESVWAFKPKPFTSFFNYHAFKQDLSKFLDEIMTSEDTEFSDNVWINVSEVVNIPVKG